MLIWAPFFSARMFPTVVQERRMLHFSTCTANKTNKTLTFLNNVVKIQHSSPRQKIYSHTNITKSC